jgi:hypothetical protein
MTQNLNILNLQVQGMDNHVVDVISATNAFKSTLVLQKLHSDKKKFTDTCPRYWNNYLSGKVCFQV